MVAVFLIAAEPRPGWASPVEGDVPSPALEGAEPPPELELQADELSIEPPYDTVVLEGDARVRRGRFQLRADRVVVRADRSGEATGGGSFATCPCDDPPVRFDFSEAEWDPEGEVTMTSPRVVAFDVPVLWLPWLWLRPPDRPGLLPPEIGWRGEDGAFVGAGVRVPLGLDVLELRAGAYAGGGGELEARLRTPTTYSRAVFDRTDETRLAISSTGSLGPSAGAGRSMDEASAPATLSWDVDVVRGARARVGEPDLSIATQPFDVARAEVSGEPSGAPASGEPAVLWGAGARLRAPRGEEPGWLGPRAFASLGSGWGAATVAGASVRTGALLARGGASTPFVVGRSEVETGASAGPARWTLATEERVRVVQAEPAPAMDAAASARLSTELPLARTFDGGAVHWVVPALAGKLTVAARDGAPSPWLGSEVEPWVGLFEGGLRTTLTQYPGEALWLDVHAGGLSRADGELQPAGQARLELEGGWIGASSEAGGAGTPSGGDLLKQLGIFSLSELRLGRIDGPAVRAETVGRFGRRALEARWFSDRRLLPGEDLATLSVAGWTGGAQLDVPWSSTLSSSTRTDLRLDRPRLLAVAAGVTFRHPCGCVAVGGVGSRRVGRDGVDVRLTVDLAP